MSGYVERALTVRGVAVHLAGSVRGLAGPDAAVEEAVERLAPRRCGAGIPPDEVEGLRRLVASGEEPPDLELSGQEEAYVAGLGRFGEVRFPSPDLLALLATCDGRGIPVTGVDLDEAAYTGAYTRNVSAVAILRNSWRVRRLARKPPGADDPASFAVAFDRAIRRTGGFARLEEAREVAMAAGVASLASESGPVYVLLDISHLDGVCRRLPSM